MWWGGGGALKMYVGIAAYSEEPSLELLEKSYLFLEELSSSCGRSIRLIVGGYWGLMKYVVDKALDLGFTVVILPPVEREHVGFPERAVVRTGLTFRARSVSLVRTSDVPFNSMCWIPVGMRAFLTTQPRHERHPAPHNVSPQRSSHRPPLR
jgi:hypothetical protein